MGDFHALIAPLMAYDIEMKLGVALAFLTVTAVISLGLGCCDRRKHRRPEARPDETLVVAQNLAVAGEFCSSS